MIAIIAVIAILVTGLASAWLVHVTLRDSRTRERAWEKKEQTWVSERQQMLDRIMYLADHPWNTPEQEVEDRYEPEPDIYDPTMSALQTFEGYDFEPMGTV